MRRVSCCPKKKKRIIIPQWKQGSKCTEVVDGSRTSGQRGIVALPQQVRGAYILIDRGRPLDRFCRFWRGRLLLSNDWQGTGQGRAIQHSAKLKCSAASRTVHSGWVQGGWGRCSFHSSTGRLRSPRPSGALVLAWSPAPLLTRTREKRAVCSCDSVLKATTI